MANKRRCSQCREYFAPDDMFRSEGIQAFCTIECLNKKAKSRSARKGTSSKIPTGTRKKVYERFGHRCVYCGRSRDDLHIHHIKYRSEGVDHTIDNLVLLCQEHHDLMHSNKRKWQPMLRAFVKAVERGSRPSLALMEKDWEKINEE